MSETSPIEQTLKRTGGRNGRKEREERTGGHLVLYLKPTGGTHNKQCEANVGSHPGHQTFYQTKKTLEKNI